MANFASFVKFVVTRPIKKAVVTIIITITTVTTIVNTKKKATIKSLIITITTKDFTLLTQPKVKLPTITTAITKSTKAKPTVAIKFTITTAPTTSITITKFGNFKLIVPIVFKTLARIFKLPLFSIKNHSGFKICTHNGDSCP